VLQLGNTVSAPFWDKVKEQIRNQHPLFAPMVDALSDSVNTQLQDTLHQKVTPLVNEVFSKAGDVAGSITAAARNIADSVNIPKLIRRYAADASRITAQRRATLTQLTAIADEQQQRVDPGQPVNPPLPPSSRPRPSATTQQAGPFSEGSCLAGDFNQSSPDSVRSVPCSSPEAQSRIIKVFPGATDPSVCQDVSGATIGYLEQYFVDGILTESYVYCLG